MTFDLSHVISITTIFTVQVIIAIDHDFLISRNQPWQAYVSRVFQVICHRICDCVNN